MYVVPSIDVLASPESGDLRIDDHGPHIVNGAVRVGGRYTSATGAGSVAAGTDSGLRVGRFNLALWWLAVAVALAGAGHWTITRSAWSADVWTAARVPAPLIVAVVLAAVLAALDPLLFIRIRTHRGPVSYGFGEISFVTACYLVPPAFLPLTTLTGVFCSQLINLWLGRLPSFSRVLSSGGALALSAAAGAAVVSVVGGPVAGVLTPSGAVAVGAGAMTFCVMSVLLVSARNAMTPPTQPWLSVLAPALSRKIPMGVGNSVVGLVGITAFSTTHWSVLAVPPIIWLLHQTYTYRLRSENERRAWKVFASATQDLTHVDERSAAQAGLVGVQRLFVAHRGQIVIDDPGGQERVYDLTHDGTSASLLPRPRATGSPVAARKLLVAGTRVGELRLFDGPPLAPSELLMLSAFGDAFAASLHDAVTSTELRTLAKTNTYNTEHDGVTGLPNRRTLLSQGALMLDDLAADAPVGLLLLDVNHFKEINTTLGIAAGDELLRVAAYRMAADRGPGELLARLGGDEFALLLTGASAEPSTVVQRARHLAGTLSQPSTILGVQVSIEASVGAVAAPCGDVDMAELLRRAEVAMYCAKRDRVTVACYDAGVREAGVDGLALLAELRDALGDRDQLYLLLQPAVTLDDCAPVSVEALVRWRHPRRGELTPVDFVRAVEQSDLLGAFTGHVLDLALAVSARLRACGTDLPVSVNLSPRSLLDADLPAVVAGLLARHGVPPSGLVLDIVETVAISRLPVVDEVLAGLRSLGVQLAVDDFGTGHSALTFLTQVPVDEIKIDRTFVTSMATSAEAAAIVRTTIELGEELGLRVVAEGVETGAQRKALMALGCRFAQGYLFHRPMPVDPTVETLCDPDPPPRPLMRLVRADHEPPG